MIKPYDKAILNSLDKFIFLGFKISNDSDYFVEFSNNKYKCKISTESFYHPSISSVIIDKNGREFSLRILKEIIDPEIFFKDQNLLKKILMEGDFEKKENVLESMQDEIEFYASVCIQQSLDFLIKWKEVVFFEPESYEAEYSKREKESLIRFGVS